MLNDSDIGPLKGSIARAYGISAGTASHRLGLGRLSRLRGLVLHGKARVPIQIGLLSYVSALFIDVLLEKAGLPCERRAELAFTGADFDRSLFIDDETAKLMKGH